MELTILLNGIQIITMNKSEIKIAIIGLGYAGLPLAVEFAKKLDFIVENYSEFVCKKYE